MQTFARFPAIFLLAAGLFFTGVGVTAAMTMDLLPHNHPQAENVSDLVSLHPATILDIA